MIRHIFFNLAVLVFASAAAFAQTDQPTVDVQREFTLKTNPSDAEIYSIDQAGNSSKLGVGSWVFHLDKDEVFKIEVRKDGYLSTQRIYERKKGGVDNDIVALAVDEAYTQSEESAIANTNFNVNVNPNISSADAWKILSGIIESYFDEIQTMDAATSYLRTNWVASIPFNKESAYRRVIRTQVVVSSASLSPLKYNVKIKSEISKVDKDCLSGSKTPAVNRDECFEPFSRILRKYNDMINEIQRRMQ